MAVSDSVVSVRGARRTRDILRMGLFFVVVLTAAVATDFAITSGLRRIETSAFGDLNRIVDGKINATVLITGSSRAVNHFDPRAITAATGAAAWNIGLNGSQTDLQLAVLAAYLNHNTAPALLIHNLDSFAFVTSRDGVAFADWYVPYLREQPIYDALMSADRSWWKARYLPLYGYAVKDMRFSWLLGVRRLFGSNPPEDRFKGFQPRSDIWNQDFERFREANPNGVHFPVEPRGVQDFERLVALASARGTKVLLVYSPVYWEMQTIEQNRTELFARFEAIAAKYGALVWDYSGSALSRDRKYFFNSQHLNATGAAEFSSSLARRIATSGMLGHIGAPGAVSSTSAAKRTPAPCCS
jgi:hypothetical protein